MSNLLDSVFEYQVLLQKHELLGLPLDSQERIRLLATQQLLTCAELLHPGRKLSDIRAWPISPDRLRVHFTTPWGFEPGELRIFTGHGVVITEGRNAAGVRKGHALDVNARVLLRIFDEHSRNEYFFPCRVVTHSDRYGVVAAFDGIPTRSSVVESIRTFDSLDGPRFGESWGAEPHRAA